MNNSVQQCAENGTTSPTESPLTGELEMEVFRAGDFGAKGTWKETDLEKLARDYSPALLEAPLTLDHARSGPAFGWVAGLRRIGDRLVARITGVPDSLRELIRRGAYKKRSVELLRSFKPTGRPYLRAVSLLGAASPAVPGLRDIVFAADEDVIAFDDDERVHALEIEVAQLRAQLREARAAVRKHEASRFVADLRARGVQVAPAEAELVEAFCLSMAEADSVVRFGQSELSPLEWLRQLFEARPPLVPQLSSERGDVHASPHPGGEASPRTDPLSYQLHQQALAMQKDDPALSYSDALSAVARVRGQFDAAHRTGIKQTH
jgi:hypothetical protein